VIKIIFDTNFLFVPIKFHIDVVSESENLLDQRIDPLLISPVLDELQRMIARSSVKMAKEAGVALEYAKRLRFVEVDSKHDEKTDDVILRISEEWQCIVATNDSELKKRLRDIKVPVIYLRERSRLELSGGNTRYY
jgi:uncharacterized protein